MERPSAGRLCHLAVTLAIVLVAGCGPQPRATTTCVWITAGPVPAFDPDGPPNTLRTALERMLTRGLVARDSSGAVVPSAAERIDVSSDSLTYTFRLRQGLAFTDGTPCRSDAFRAALVAGLGRKDHATRAWVLAAVKGVDQVRAGRPLPATLGIETPDAMTLVLRLARPDPLLLDRLALPGVSAAWKERDTGSWLARHGLGPYRVVRGEARRLVMALGARPQGTAPAPGPDTVVVRFGLGAGRIRSILRESTADLVWPVPPALPDEPLPAGYRWQSRPSVPHRRLLLVVRGDTPPTTKLAARHALAHGLNRDDLLRALGPVASETGSWLTGAGRFEFPALDPSAVRLWLDRGNLGRSFHVVMAYDPDGAGERVARLIQGEWAGHAIYAEPRPLRGHAFEEEALTGRAHMLLVEAQSLLDRPEGDLAGVVMPIRGPAVGSFRTGWRTREFDSWIQFHADAPPLEPGTAQRRLEEERVVLPIAELPWLWVEREGVSGVAFHPGFGPQCTAEAPLP